MTMPKIDKKVALIESGKTVFYAVIAILSAWGFMISEGPGAMMRGVTPDQKEEMGQRISELIIERLKLDLALREKFQGFARPDPWTGRDGEKSRELITQNTQQLVRVSVQLDGLTGQFETLKGGLSEVIKSVNACQERLARIEG